MKHKSRHYSQHSKEKAMFGIKDNDYDPNDRWLRMLATTYSNDMFVEYILCSSTKAERQVNAARMLP